MSSLRKTVNDAKEKQAANSPFLKFKGGDIATLRIDGPHVERTFKGEDGKEKPSFEFPITLLRMMRRNDDGELVMAKGYSYVQGGEEKDWGITSMRLLELIADEDDIESVVGRYFDVHCIGEGFKRTWKLRALSDKQVEEITGGTKAARKTTPDVKIEEKESFKPTLPEENDHKPKAKEQTEKSEQTCASIDEMEKKATEMEKKKKPKKPKAKTDAEKIEKV